ncbi:RdlA protein [Streptomyces sp. MUM 203J]|uniref:rodlin n=1 Tax=Streptomyces sp. MUM 203J TaxID=2791990 RepID=UPI001F03E3BD|nr:rodlin [Streptomyces sp. MUM 203J]MCH0540802.1 RdlA protein [Streptomyces sp. MUM 203J]
MIKKVVASAGIAAAAIGACAPMAFATGDHNVDTQNGNFSEQAHGNTVTGGYASPQMSLVQGSLNKLCAGVPVAADVQNILLVNVGVQDLVNDTQDQQCVENSTAVKGDSALSHLVESVASENLSLSSR